MDGLMTWFEALNTLQQVFWGCAILGSLVFVVQAILTLVGMDSTDVDFDIPDGDTLDFGGLSLFSIRNLVNFFVGFGWGGVSFYSTVSNPLLLVLIATVSGVLFVLISGYFQCTAGFRPQSVTRLLAQVWFYSLSLFLVCRFGFGYPYTADMLWQVFLPVRRKLPYQSTKQYSMQLPILFS